jgi:hypothetical protein
MKEKKKLKNKKEEEEDIKVIMKFVFKCPGSATP